MEKIKVVCVVGPTASGKSELGINIAKMSGGEIVSADSMQIYKGAHIASAAVDHAETRGIKHHLIEFLQSDEIFTVYDYLKKAREVIADISYRGKLPVIVGGTGLYINALLDGVRLCENTSDEETRLDIEREFDEKGAGVMLKELESIDPDTAKKLSESDRRRIVRALEIYRITGLTKTEHDKISLKSGKDYDYTAIGIAFKDREKLYERINFRVDEMIKRGLLEEAKSAYNRKDAQTSGLVQAIGHKEFFPYFEGSMDLETATENLKRATRKYAKRQMTWFNKREDINWIFADCEDVNLSALKILERQGYTLEKQ